MNNNFLSTPFILIFVFVIIALLMGGYFFATSNFFTQREENQDVSSSQDAQDEFSSASGYIYFSDDEEGTARSIPHVFDFETKDISVMSDDGVSYVRSIVPVRDNALGVAYLRAPFEPNDEWAFPYTEFLKLIYKNKDGVERVIDDRVVGEARGLRWSESANMFAYDGLSKESTANQRTVSHILTDNWSVYLVSARGDDMREIVGGVSPVWSTDGTELYYLGSKGIYRYNVESEKTEEFFVDDRFEIPSAASLTLTADGNMLVLASPLGYGFFVYDIVYNNNISKAVFTNFYKTTNNKSPYAITSSPNENYIAYATFNDNVSIMNILNLKTGGQKELFALPVVYKHYSFMPTWSLISPQDLDDFTIL